MRIEAVAKYVHHFSQFYDDPGMKNQYFFTYQIRIRGPREDDGEVEGDADTFYACRLTRRHWVINQIDESHVVDGEGVIGYFPTIRRDMEEDFVYESVCPTPARGTTMHGHF